MHDPSPQVGVSELPIVQAMRTRSRAEVDDTSAEVGLTRVEDNELRRLNWLAQRGELTERMRERMIDLRLRDRRKTIRRPRLVADD